MDTPRIDASLGTLLPILGIVFIAFLVIGMAMPVLPLHVHQGLGLSTFVVGLVAGSQFAASLVSRVWAGRHSDTNGAKSAVVVGLIVSAGAGLLYLLSMRFNDHPTTAVVILLMGRALLGAGESFIITGAQLWGLAVAGAHNTGRVLAWMGSAMYAAFALGAPLGTALYGTYGFAAIGVATLVAPLVTLLLALPVPRTAHVTRVHASFKTVLEAVWIPGVGLALSSVGFGSMIAFLSLLFASKGWTVWPAFTSFAAAFILARMLLGHLPDKIGGAKVALIFLVIEAAGQALLWAAPMAAWALLGAALTGFGYSLVYPGFGVEAVRRAPPQSRGVAMGVYTAFLDLTLGLASPVLGLIAGTAGIGSVFLVSAVVVICAVLVALKLLRPIRGPVNGTWNDVRGARQP